MSRRTYFDGLNLALPRGTGIATYTRLLASIVHDLGYETGIVYSSPGRPPKNPLLREISFFDYRGDKKVPILREIWDGLTDQVRSPFGIKPSPLNLSGVVV
ncbi:MAG: glycosyltransferase family 1 protein, partial [Alphaproteobacteria bacterium]|nr:glycosyltransferase family 1 protein [Alphaproteobacteria bacterium]